MKYIEAPTVYEGEEKSLFLAGSITNAPDWQRIIVNLLKDEEIVILNPRRKHFSINDQKAAPTQIAWEYEHLRKATAISFWFSKETLNPIVLYELGAWSMSKKPVFVGIEPEYQRRRDVEIQTELVRPDVKIVNDLHALSEQIKLWINK